MPQTSLLQGLRQMLVRPAPTAVSGGADPNQDYALWVIRWAMTIGLLGMILMSCLFTYTTKVPTFGAFAGTLGYSIIISLAAAVTGGILGFIFGVPRSAQNTNGAQATAAAASTTSGSTSNDQPAAAAVQTVRPYDPNTNLEQISDWLAKIIVGVGLTQIPQIEQRFDRLASVLAAGYHCDYDCLPILKAYAGAIVIFFSICGFMAVYLWARIYLLKQLSDQDKFLSLNKEMRQYRSLANETRRKQLLAKIKAFGRQANKVASAEQAFADILGIARPNPVTVLDDSQKGRWGGQPVADGYSLDAAFSKKSEDDNIYTISLTVTATNPTVKPLIEPVYFFLHESFGNSMVSKVEPVNGAATLEINSYEAFTVGVVCDNGAVKLELDLNEHPACPENYKYIDGLETIDELQKQLEALESGQSDS